MTMRAHSPVGAPPTAPECPRSPGQPPADAPLLAASAIRARIVSRPHFLLCRVAVQRPRAAGTIARLADAREPPFPAMPLATCVASRVAFCRAIGAPPRS